VLGQVVKALEALDLADDAALRPGLDRQQPQQAQRDGDQHAGQHAEHQDAQGRAHGQRELAVADGVPFLQRRQVEQPDRGDDDHGGQRRGRHVSERRG